MFAKRHQVARAVARAQDVLETTAQNTVAFFRLDHDPEKKIKEIFYDDGTLKIRWCEIRSGFSSFCDRTICLRGPICRNNHKVKQKRSKEGEYGGEGAKKKTYTRNDGIYAVKDIICFEGLGLGYVLSKEVSERTSGLWKGAC